VFTGATLDETGNLVGGHIGLDDYPIFDESYRETLNRKIINRYLNREIGLENPERFIHNLSRRMHEIMPAYNELYETTQLAVDPLRTVDMLTITTGKTESERQTTSANTSSTTAGSKSRQISSDYPQFQLAENADYATAGADSNAQNTASGTGSATDASTGKDDVTGDSRVTGYQGSPYDLILRARAAIINIDLAIIEELSDLFMLVWDNGTEFLPSNWKGNL